jgi:hypothetical protein
MAEEGGIRTPSHIERTQLTGFTWRFCHWNRSNRRSRVQFRYRPVARSLRARVRLPHASAKVPLNLLRLFPRQSDLDPIKPEFWTQVGPNFTVEVQMRLTEEQSRTLLANYGVYATEVCDKCRKIVGAIRFTRYGHTGEWCSKWCRNGFERKPGACLGRQLMWKSMLE